MHDRGGPGGPAVPAARAPGPRARRPARARRADRDRHRGDVPARDLQPAALDAPGDRARAAGDRAAHARRGARDDRRALVSAPTTERLRLADLGAADLRAWSALAERAGEDNAFGLPEYLRPAALHLAGGDAVDLLVVRDGDRWLACVPLVGRVKFSDLLVPCARTWNHPYAFLWTPLVDRDATDVVAVALAGAPALWRGRGSVVLEAIADGPLAAALRALGPGTLVHGVQQRAAVVRRPQDDYVSGHLDGRARREHARTRRILARELGGAPAFVETDDDEALDRFLVLEAAGWKGAAGSAMASDPSHEAFLRAVWRGFRARGAAHLLELRHGPRVAASVLCVRAGDTIYSLKTAHDETLRRGAPGVQLMADLATWFHEATDATL
ncbi:MAG: GNAT family N-acetyltransferase, partial [Actinobacteria bacterium]|nr:GNAT family N-acetyltransferase [Actinomycetota bacterium]